MKNIKTTVYIADCDELKNSELFNSSLASVKEYRKEKINKLRFYKDKRLSLGAELLLINALDDVGIDYEKAEIILGENGKPYLSGNGIYYNLSHSGNLAVCAVSAEEVGVDIEKIEKVDLKIAKRVLSASEMKEFEMLCNDEEKKRELIRLWTLKESYMKYKGAGFGIDPRSVCFAEKEKNKEPGNLFFSQYKLENYYISCCAKNNCFEDDLTFISLDNINY